MYWEVKKDGTFPPMNCGQYISRSRFEDIIRYLQLSPSDGKAEQSIKFIDAFNKVFKKALTPGDSICLDESVVKSFHCGLKGKMKIIRKPRLVGNEFKNLFDACTNAVTHLELYERRGIMSKKEFVKEYVATAATVLCLTDEYYGTGRIVAANSWFGLVKSANALMQKELYANMLVKAAQKGFLRDQLNEKNLSTGDWVAYHATIDVADLLFRIVLRPQST